MKWAWMFSVTPIEPSGAMMMVDWKSSMRSSRVVSADTEARHNRTAKAAAVKKRSGRGRIRLIADLLTGSRRRRGGAEAYLGSFAFRWCGNLEEFAWPKAQHVGKDIGRKLLNLCVQVAHHGVVVAAGVLDRVLNLRQRILQ